MTIDKAVAIIQQAHDNAVLHELDDIIGRRYGYIAQAFAMALEALREKAARENPEPQTIRQNWITQILSERDRQDAKWGFPQENTYCEWSSILAEETGELAKELNELNFGRGSVDRMTEEAVQVAAVALSILEHQEIAHMVTAAWLVYRQKLKEE